MANEGLRVYSIYEIEWKQQAHRNLVKWGPQPVERLLLCMMEELGELTQAHLQYTYDPIEPDEDSRTLRFNRIKCELRDLMALGHQLQWALEAKQ